MIQKEDNDIHQTLTVNDLKPGGTGVIVEVLGRGPIRQRLMDLGIIEGAEVEMVRRAPFGDPVQIKVLNTLLAMRRSEADMLVIEITGETTSDSTRRHRHRTGWKSQLR